MPFELSAEDVDFDLLAVYLKALSNPGRLELLWRLRFPASSGDLTVAARRRDAMRPGRPMSRQALDLHLAQLERIRVVSRVPNPEGGADRWATNVPQVFGLLEELRKLTAIPAAPAVDVEETVASRGGALTAWPAGPKLVLLSGPWEGKVFELHGKGPWTIGRSRTREVALTYDPFVSAEHAALALEGKGAALKVAADARNPARINFVPLAPGATRELRHGDVVGVGRSLLLYHAD